MNVSQESGFWALLLAFLRDFVAFSGRWRASAGLALTLFAAALEGVSLALLLPLLALLTEGSDGPIQRWVDPALEPLGIVTPMGKLAVLVALVVVAIALRAAVNLWRDRVLAGLQTEYIEHRRVRLLTALARSHWSDVATLRHARVTSALTIDLARLAAVVHLTMQTIVAVTLLTVQLAMTILFVPLIGLMALAILALASAVGLRRVRVASQHGDAMGERALAMVDTAGQLLSGLKSAVAENRQGAFVADFAASSAQTTALQQVFQRRATSFQFVLTVTTAVTGAGLLLGGLAIGADRSALIAAVLALVRMAGPVAGLQRCVEGVAQSLPAFGTSSALEDTLQAAVHDGGEPSSFAMDDIVLDAATYVYPGGAGVRDLSLRMAPGEIVGIVGASGSGKTTLVDLVAGLLVPQSGEVRWGSTVLNRNNATQWRQQIAYAGQDPQLINDTIRRNLCTKASEITDQEIWDALDRVGVAAVVRAMPEGLDTVVAERGSRLSGGERQRIAIARALLRRPALLVLDEATNAIDVDSESQLLAELSGLTPPPIILIVAHRSASLARCKRIVTIDQGRIGEVRVAG